MSPGLSWQLHLHLPPSRVFAALVSATARHGRLHDVEESDRVVTIASGSSSAGAAPGLRARVHPSGDGGSLLVLDPLTGSRHGADVSGEAESIRGIVRDLRDQLGLPPEVETA